VRKAKCGEEKILKMLQQQLAPYQETEQHTWRRCGSEEDVPANIVPVVRCHAGRFLPVSIIAACIANPYPATKNPAGNFFPVVARIAFFHIPLASVNS
jgi:hypothetical protein